MSNEQPEKQNEVTPKGAVEVSEEDLDQAAGGVLIGLLLPAVQKADSASLNYSKIDPNLAGQKVAPTDAQSCLNNKNPEL
jgi:hypothetical protein